MENTERKEGMLLPGETLELCIDHDHITIPVPRFEELVKAEAKLEIVGQIYKTVESYNMKDTLAFVFGPLPSPEKGDENA